MRLCHVAVVGGGRGKGPVARDNLLQGFVPRDSSCSAIARACQVPHPLSAQEASRDRMERDAEASNPCVHCIYPLAVFVVGTQLRCAQIHDQAAHVQRELDAAPPLPPPNHPPDEGDADVEDVLQKSSSDNTDIKTLKTMVVYSFEGRKRKFPISIYGTQDIAIRCAEARTYVHTCIYIYR